jgi:hypothetical protein
VDLHLRRQLFQRLQNDPASAGLREQADRRAGMLAFVSDNSPDESRRLALVVAAIHQIDEAAQKWNAAVPAESRDGSPIAGSQDAAGHRMVVGAGALDSPKNNHEPTAAAARRVGFHR